MMKYLLAVIALAAAIACMDGGEGDLLNDSFERTTGIGGTWHDRYIEDNCSRCPDCCVVEDFGKYDDPNWKPEEYPCSERSPRSNCFEEPGWADAWTPPDDEE